MKLSIDPKTLAETVTWAVRAITQRPAIPILAGVLLEADADRLRVSAFDYDYALRADVAADVAEPGRVVVPGRVLAELVKTLPDGLFADLAVSGTELSITCGRSAFTLLTLPVDDYPALPEPPVVLGTVDGTVLRTAVEQVATAATKDTTLPALTCVRLDTDGEQLTLAATDRYRIAVRDLPWTPHTGGDIEGALVPHEKLADIAKSLRGPVSIGWDNRQFGCAYEGRTIVVRLIDEKYIQYRPRVEYDHLPIAITVDTAQLVTAVKRVTLLVEKNGGVKLEVADGEVLLRAAGDAGRGIDAISCELEGADTFTIAFQPQFLLDALAGVEQPRVALHSEPGHKPALVRGEDSDSYRCLVMALRLA